VKHAKNTEANVTPIALGAFLNSISSPFPIQFSVKTSKVYLYFM
jgi:hypothetical protein